ncbi:MAG: hypothetical protein AAGC44_13525 [Planctomycetota bacterium]
MQYIHDEKHDELSAIYQSLEVGRLDEALRESGIEDEELIRQVCETYFFKSGYFFDSCYFDIEGVRYRPCLSFEEIDDENQPAGRIYLVDAEEGGMMHEHAHQSVDWYFGLESSDNPPPDVEEGNLHFDEEAMD